MKILVKFPTFNRPKQFFNTLYEYYKKCSSLNDIYFLVSIDTNDITMNNQKVLEGIGSYPNLKLIIGDSLSKIHAINRDIDLIDIKWDILLLASDDMVPVKLGYDDIIRSDMKRYYNNLDGVLWYNDGFQKDKLNTLSILGYNYYKRFNYIYYPEYKSVYADNEFTEVSKILNKVKYFDNVIIQHQHPDWGFGKNDLIHLRNQKDVNQDLNLFNNRKSINFNLS